MPTVHTTPLADEIVPSPTKKPCTKSRASWRAVPLPCRTPEPNSFTAQVSPCVTSKPAAAMFFRASTPAWYQEPPPSVTQLPQADMLISARALKFDPSARIQPAWSDRSCVLLSDSGGTEM